MELIVHSKVYGTKTVFYDDEDHDLVSKIKWNLFKGKRTFYARGKVKKKYLLEMGCRMIRMHRLVMKCPNDLQIDHKDGDGLNNSKSNLRIVTNAENGKNKRLSIDSSTGFKGVTFVKKKKLYFARIRVDGKLISGGRSKDILAAAKKYNELAIKYFGEFAQLNTIPNE